MSNESIFSQDTVSESSSENNPLLPCERLHWLNVIFLALGEPYCQLSRTDLLLSATAVLFQKTTWSPVIESFLSMLERYTS